MIIGLLKEVKSSEQRILLTPKAVQSLYNVGNEILVEKDAGINSNFPDDQYEQAGATIIPTSEKIFKNAELILKVQSPLPIEYDLFTKNHISFSFLQLPNNPDRLKALVDCQSIFFALEMIENSKNIRPILNPMSEIAGKIAIIEGAKYLEKSSGGKGILLQGVNDVPSAKVTVIGAGVAGTTAAKQALAMNANVCLLDSDFKKLDAFKDKYDSKNLTVFKYNPKKLQDILPKTDLLITAAYVSGQTSPIVVTKDDVKLLQQGSVIIDLGINHGGCVETARPTTLENPVIIQDGIIYYCVTNIPSAVPNTSSQALSNVVLPYLIQISQLGIKEVLATNPEIRSGLSIYRGKVAHPLLADALKQEYYDILELLELNL